MKNKLFCAAQCNGVINKEKRTVHVIASTGVIDRQGESVNPDGWLLERFMKNPVALVAHNYKGLPVGRYTKVWVQDGALQGHVEIADTDEGRQLFYLIENGFLNAVSVGFVVKQWGKSGTDEYTIMSQELLEISFVAVPANPDALITNGVDEDLKTLEKTIDEKGQKLELTKEEKTTEEVEQIKGINEIYSLADIASYLNYVTRQIENDRGDDEVVKHMKAALTELMKAIEIEAGLGAKQFNVRDVQKDIIKEALHEVYKEINITEEKKEDVKANDMSDTAIELMLGIQKELREKDKEIGLRLRLINQLLNSASSEDSRKGGEK